MRNAGGLGHAGWPGNRMKIDRLQTDGVINLPSFEALPGDLREGKWPAHSR